MNTEKPRVLFVSPQPFYEWRGSPIRVSFDVRALARLGFDVHLLTLPVGQRHPVPGVHIYRAPNLFRAKKVPIGPSFIKICFDLVLLVMAFRLHHRHRYAAIHCIEDAGMIGALVSAVTGVRFVFEKHSDPYSYGKTGLKRQFMRIYAGVEQFMVRRAHAVIGTGPGLAAQAKAMGARGDVHAVCDIPSSLVESVPGEVAAVRAELAGSEDDVLAAYVGSFAVYQGIELLFDSIPAALRDDDRLRFVIIGGTAAEVESRRAALVAVGLADRVRFVGKVPPDRLPAYLSASDILLSPRMAGVNTPLKLLDYLKAARAIVATDTEANRLILDETTALLTAPTPAAFAAGIVALVRDGERRESVARCGRRLVDEVYNFDVFTNGLGACYAGLGLPVSERG